MKYLIVGLGNVGDTYAHTRHNIGFDVLDRLAKDNKLDFSSNTLGDTVDLKYKGRTITLLKPSTFMNLSGKALKYWMDKLKIDPENILVIVDDIHLDIGKMRLRNKGSDGGHNGLKDIEAKLGHTNYIRLRMGVGKDFFPGQQVQYVLGRWKPDQIDDVDTMISKAGKAILNFATIGLKLTMDELNRS
jgi:peptidyl-tRNA hydrolase, PTH1 family